MTTRDLLELLQELPPEDLDKEICVHDQEGNDRYDIYTVHRIIGDEDVIGINIATLRDFY
jgi:hypothetical protein